jgi:hypothetical protein
MKFDFSINLGNLVSIVAMVFTLYGFHIQNVKRFMKLEFQVRQMWGSFRRKFNIHDEDFFGEDEVK